MPPVIGSVLVVVIHPFPCLNDVHDIISQFFAFGDEVNVEDTELVAVQAGVDILQILVFQLRAVVVDFVLNVDAGGDAVFRCRTVHTLQHGSESVFHQLHHRLHVLRLFGGERLRTMLTMAVECTAEIIHRVADALQF